MSTNLTSPSKDVETVDENGNNTSAQAKDSELTAEAVGNNGDSSAAKQDEKETRASVEKAEQEEQLETEERRKENGRESDYQSAFGISLGLTVWAVIGFFVLWRTEFFKAFLSNWWGKALVVLIAVLIWTAPSIPAIQKSFKHTTAQRRIGILVLGVIPAVLTLVGMTLLLPLRYQAAVLRIIFLFVVCLLPAIMYYLFIATRKNSLWHEYVIYLNRMGLLEANSETTRAEANQNHLVYLQKFESVYGALNEEQKRHILEPSKLDQVSDQLQTNKSDSSSQTIIFTSETTIPIILATVLIALGWLITLPPIQAWQAVTQEEQVAFFARQWFAVFTPEQATVVHYAFIGAYFFSIQMLFRRYVRRDLRASAYVAVSMRIILAVIGSWIIVAAIKTILAYNNQTLAANDDRLIVYGFAIGVFPLIVWQFVQSVFARIGGFVLPSLKTQLPISDLDGLTVWHESRLEEEDIENIPNMATADMIDLMLNTRFSPERIIDWVDQAILYTALGPEKTNGNAPKRRELLRMHGIRTASALLEAYKKSADQNRNDRDAFEKILPIGNNERSSIRTLVDVIGTNPNLQLIQNWRRLNN